MDYARFKLRLKNFNSASCSFFNFQNSDPNDEMDILKIVHLNRTNRKKLTFNIISGNMLGAQKSNFVTPVVFGLKQGFIRSLYEFF